MDEPRKVAIVTRGDGARYGAIAQALREAGLAPAICAYDEVREAEVRAELAASDAALVFVNPIQDGRRRDGLNALLEDAVAAGVLVSGRPDVIAKLGVKAVLWRTRALGWSGDARFYETPEALADGLVQTLASGPRVLKQNRGNGGIGVWKLTPLAGGVVEVQAATEQGACTAALDDFLRARIAEIAGAGGYVDQAYQPRLPEGMLRCYMSGDRLAGFGHHLVRMLAPPDAGPGGPRLYSGADDPRFQALRLRMEREWTPGLCRILGIAPDDLPVIWDADFLLGARDADGRDTHVLCEINASCVFPMPDEAPKKMARTLADRLAERGGPRPVAGRSALSHRS